MRPEMTYDPEADALLIRLSDAKPHDGGDAGPMILHYAKDGRVVGIEVLGASRKLSPGAWSEAPLPGSEDRKVHAAE